MRNVKESNLKACICIPILELEPLIETLSKGRIRCYYIAEDRSFNCEETDNNAPYYPVEYYEDLMRKLLSEYFDVTVTYISGDSNHDTMFAAIFFEEKGEKDEKEIY